jgi:BlaI family transcriptional regulator, penicillinase repressor
MARPASGYPTELELQILKVLWHHAPQPVSQVREALAAQDRKLAHTSVITTLNTMVRKAYLKRVKDGKTWLFSPRVAEADVSRRMLADVVDRVFDGSAKSVLLSLFDNRELDADELKELRQLINQKLKGQTPI